MDFAFSDEQEALRQDVRQFLTEELGPDHLPDQWQVRCQEVSRKVARRGWIGMTWPKEYGGRAASYLDRLVVTEELLRYGAPVGYHFSTDRQIAPSIIRFGSEAQKRELLPKILNAETSFCILYSEPEAGSDLANVKTSAVQIGDEFIVNGQKIWTSGAHLADYGWMLAVTDPAAERRYTSFSALIVDLKLPGVTIRPIEDASGDHTFNHVFLDNVHLPRTALVGELNRGWYQITAELDYERSGIERIMANWPLFDGVVSYVKEGKGRGVPVSSMRSIRQKLADLLVAFEVGRLLIYKVAWMLDRGQLPNSESAMAKAYGTTFEQRLADTVVDVLGPAGLLMPDSKWAPMLGQAAKSYLRSPSYTLQGGTVEILRGIVAGRGLGLPSR